MFGRLHSQASASLKAFVWAAFASAGVTSAAPFQNLDFEAASFPYVPIGQGFLAPTTEAFPGWTAYLGTTPISHVQYNLLPAGGAAVVLFQPETLLIQGRYTAFLVPGYDDRTASLVGVSLEQTGFVPSGAQTILFYAAPLASPAPFEINVELNGQEIDLVPLQKNGNVTLFAGDVSAFAGTTAELRFTVNHGNIAADLDAISFSPVPVPELSTWALVGTGLLCLAGHIRKRARP